MQRQTTRAAFQQGSSTSKKMTARSFWAVHLGSSWLKLWLRSQTVACQHHQTPSWSDFHQNWSIFRKSQQADCCPWTHRGFIIFRCPLSTEDGLKASVELLLNQVPLRLSRGGRIQPRSPPLLIRLTRVGILRPWREFLHTWLRSLRHKTHSFWNASSQAHGPLYAAALR